MNQFLRRVLRRGAMVRTLPSLEAYQKWAGNYPPHAHNALMRAEENAMLDLMPPLQGKYVLDLASGTGRYTEIARERGAANVIALDNSVPMLTGNRALCRAAAAMDSVPLASSSIDVVLCGLAVGHVPSLDGMMCEIARVLVPTGAALISDVHPVLFKGGAKRTFRVQGRVYAVEHYIHEYSAFHTACERAGLRIQSVREPHLLDADQPPQGERMLAPVAIVYLLHKL